MTATALDNHVLVLLEDDVGLVVEIEYRNRSQLCRCAAGLWYLTRIHQVHQGLYDGVIRGVHVRVQRKVAFPAAVVGVETLGSNYPVLPGQILEAHVQGLNSASLSAVLNLGIDVGIEAPVEVTQEVGRLLALAFGFALAPGVRGRDRGRLLPDPRAFEEADHEGLLVGLALESHNSDVLGLHLVDVSISRVNRQV